MAEGAASDGAAASVIAGGLSARLDVKELLKIPTGRVAGNKAIRAVLADREEL